MRRQSVAATALWIERLGWQRLRQIGVRIQSGVAARFALSAAALQKLAEETSFCWIVVRNARKDNLAILWPSIAISRTESRRAHLDEAPKQCGAIQYLEPTADGSPQRQLTFRIAIDIVIGINSGRNICFDTDTDSDTDSDFDFTAASVAAAPS